MSIASEFDRAYRLHQQGKLREAFMRDALDCREIEFDAWAHRPWRHRLVDAACFLGRREL